MATCLSLAHWTASYHPMATFLGIALGRPPECRFAMMHLHEAEGQSLAAAVVPSPFDPQPSHSPSGGAVFQPGRLSGRMNSPPEIPIARAEVADRVIAVKLEVVAAAGAVDGVGAGVAGEPVVALLAG